MRYQLKQIHCRPWLLNGLSLRLMESHYENNYGGAVRRLNAIADELASLDFAKTPGYRINGLKREELVALNSMILHELFFASLGGEGNKPTDAIRDALAASFGSFERWRAEFVAMGNALGGGSGWVVLAYVPRDRRFVNQYAGDHTQSVASGLPLLALDMYEHAYHLDFGANVKAYVDAFMRNIDWKGVEDRFADAQKVEPMRPLAQSEFGDLPGIAVEDVKAMLDAGKPVQLIDARPRHYTSRVPDIAEGAKWRDPDSVQSWMGELSKDEPVVVFCAYGFHVGCKTAIVLREAGFDARYMTSGHSGWKAMGGPVRLNA
jgi:Fe-Mn family superoxide dismutase